MHLPSGACKLGHTRTDQVYKLYQSATSGKSPLRPAMPGFARRPAILRESTPEPAQPEMRSGNRLRSPPRTSF